MSIRSAEMQYCNKCGRPLNDGEVCGCMQSSPPPYSQGYAYGGQSLPSPKKKSYTLLFAIGIPLLCVFALVIALALLPVSSGIGKQRKQRELTKAAKEMTEAADKALQRVKADGEEIRGINIITSENEAIDGYICSFDADKFRSYFSEDTKYSDKCYFIFINDGKTEYLAVSDKWNDNKGIIGTYPSVNKAGMKYSADGSVKRAGKDTDLMDLYTDGVHELYEASYKGK
jgi:hypothetical protein